MAASAPLPSSRTHPWFKRILFVLFGIMSAFVLYHTDRFLFVHRMRDWGYYYPVRWWIVIHALAGATALILGPFQFSLTLRRQRPALHRLLGYVYLSSIAVAAPIAIYLGFTHATPAMALPTLMQSLLWLVTAAAAFLAARHCNFEIHRQWMIRTYAVTMIFVFTRVFMALPVLEHRGFAALVPLLWILNIAALLITQLGLDWMAFSASCKAESK